MVDLAELRSSPLGVALSKFFFFFLIKETPIWGPFLKKLKKKPCLGQQNGENKRKKKKTHLGQQQEKQKKERKEEWYLGGSGGSSAGVTVQAAIRSVIRTLIFNPFSPSHKSAIRT